MDYLIDNRNLKYLSKNILRHWSTVTVKLNYMTTDVELSTKATAEHMSLTLLLIYLLIGSPNAGVLYEWQRVFGELLNDENGNIVCYFHPRRKSYNKALADFAKDPHL